MNEASTMSTPCRCQKANPGPKWRQFTGDANAKTKERNSASESPRLSQKHPRNYQRVPTLHALNG